MRDGLKWLDSDMHMAEPWNLWREYIAPEFRDRLEELTGVEEGHNPLTHPEHPGDPPVTGLYV